jgi:hypothetical protein
MTGLKLLVSFSCVLVLAAYVRGAESRDNESAVKTDQFQRESNEEPRREYQEYFDKKLTEFHERLTELETEAAKTGDKAKLKFREASKEFEKQMAAARRKLERIKDEGAKNWEEVKDKMTATMRDLERSYERLAHRWSKPSDKS